MLGLALGPVIVLAVASTLGLGATPLLMAPGIVLGLILNLVAPPRVPAARRARVGLFDRRLVLGPVGLLALAGTFVEIVFVTFTSALPLWLVEHRDVGRDSALLAWTLTAFYLSAAVGGVATGALGRWVERRHLVVGTMLLTPVPLFAVFVLDPGGAPYFLAVALAGALTNAAFPLLVVSAQDLAPHAVGTASGMLMGLPVGAAGLLYVGIGWLQERIGMGAAMGASYLFLIPAAILSYAVLTKHHVGSRVRRLNHS